MLSTVSALTAQNIGAGKHDRAKATLKIAIISTVVFGIFARIPLSYIGSTYFTESLFPMGLAASIGSVLSVIICIIAFMWMRKHPERLKIA